MNTIEGFDYGNVAVRKICRNVEGDASYEIHLGGSLESGGSLVVLKVHSLEAATALFEACREIQALEVAEL